MAKGKGRNMADTWRKSEKPCTHSKRWLACAAPKCYSLIAQTRQSSPFTRQLEKIARVQAIIIDSCRHSLPRLVRGFPVWTGCFCSLIDGLSHARDDDEPGTRSIRRTGKNPATGSRDRPRAAQTAHRSLDLPGFRRVL